MISDNIQVLAKENTKANSHQDKEENSKANNKVESSGFDKFEDPFPSTK